VVLYYRAESGVVYEATPPAPPAPVIMSSLRVRVRVRVGLGLGCRWSKRHYHWRRCAGGVIEYTQRKDMTWGQVYTDGRLVCDLFALQTPAVRVEI